MKRVRKQHSPLGHLRGHQRSRLLSCDSFFRVIPEINQPPIFIKGSDLTVLEDIGQQSISHWATGISTGSPKRAQSVAQVYCFHDNQALFSAAPKIDSDGKLHFAPAANAYGTANLMVRLMDSGGTANGGVDTSAAQTFVISVLPVNGRPSFTKGGRRHGLGGQRRGYYIGMGEKHSLGSRQRIDSACQLFSQKLLHASSAKLVSSAHQEGVELPRDLRSNEE